MSVSPLPLSRGPRAQLAWDTIHLQTTSGIPSWMLHIMDPEFIEAVTDEPPGAFRSEPDRVYCAFQNRIGTCYLDQYLASNVLSMGQDGFAQDTRRRATTGLEQLVLDGLPIDSPEAVVDHLQRFIIPATQRRFSEFSANSPSMTDALARESSIQKALGPDILKGPYSRFFDFPRLRYEHYGYVNYFMAYALYPEVIERDFATQADLAILYNRQSAQAIRAAGLPPLLRLDHDLADSRGPLVDVRSLDRLWFPHFARAIAPLLDAGIRLIWHCDGNLVPMVPRLLEVGIAGFQGFQYEDGMDYPAISRMKTRTGEDLVIIAGVSVTRTLPFGTRQDVIDQLEWLVDNGPRRGLVLGASSSITPLTNRSNIRTLIEGLNHYRHHGRD